MVLAATPNQHSSGLIRRCSTTTIDNDIMALMRCPSVLSAPTLMGYLYAYNSILRAPHTMRRVDVVLTATPNLASSGQQLVLLVKFLDALHAWKIIHGNADVLPWTSSLELGRYYSSWYTFTSVYKQVHSTIL